MDADFQGSLYGNLLIFIAAATSLCLLIFDIGVQRSISYLQRMGGTFNIPWGFEWSRFAVVTTQLIRLNPCIVLISP